jgi:hypothetical protein
MAKLTRLQCDRCEAISVDGNTTGWGTQSRQSYTVMNERSFVNQQDLCPACEKEHGHLMREREIALDKWWRRIDD